MKWLILAFCLALCGCNSLGSAPNQKSNLASSSSTTNVCPKQPSGILNQSDVKAIALSSTEINETGIIWAGQNLGYVFDAKVKQKVSFNTKENLCLYIFSPSNQLLNGTDLSEDGKYTVQVTVPSGTTTFNLAIKLISPISSNIVQSPQTAVIASPPTASVSSISTVSQSKVLDVNTAKLVIESLYVFLSNRAWADSQSLITSELYPEFEPGFFKQFNKVSVQNLNVNMKTDTFISFVGTNTYFYPDGATQTEERSYEVKLVNNKPLISSSSFIRVIKGR